MCTYPKLNCALSISNIIPPAAVAWQHQQQVPHPQKTPFNLTFDYYAVDSTSASHHPSHIAHPRNPSPCPIPSFIRESCLRWALIDREDSAQSSTPRMPFTKGAASGRGRRWLGGRIEWVLLAQHTHHGCCVCG